MGLLEGMKAVLPTVMVVEVAAVLMVVVDIRGVIVDVIMEIVVASLVLAVLLSMAGVFTVFVKDWGGGVVGGHVLLVL